MARRSKLSWHEEVLDAAGHRAASRLAPLAGQFYLAGGTALALRLGHRVSLDLDLFSSENPLGFAQRGALVGALKASGTVEVRESADGTLHLILEGTRVSLLRYAYPLLGKADVWRGVRVASIEDIAAMKLSAVVGRGSKKDFLDLYRLARELPLGKMLELARRKFPEHPDFPLQAAKALVYFADADSEPAPRLLEEFDWSEVKRFSEREGPRAVSRLL